LKVTLSSLYTEICSASPESATITWLSANRSVLMSLFLAVLIPFIPCSFHSAIIWDTWLLNYVCASDSLVELLYLLLSAVSKWRRDLPYFSLDNARVNARVIYIKVTSTSQACF
jgi:hypothetical protein